MTKRKPPRNSLSGLSQFQFHLLARLSERKAEGEMQKGFGVRLFEARIICMVGSVEACPFKVLTTFGQFEKGYASRAVAALVRRGLMVSETDTVDQRATVLRLTKAGEKLHREIIAEAVRRDERWLAGLPAKERDGLKRALATLFRLSIGVGPEEFGAEWRPPAASRSRTTHRLRK